MKKQISSREDILETSKQMVRESGIDKLAIRDLAGRCGISSGTVYNYFPSKEALLAEVAVSIWGEILGDVEDMDRLDFWEKIRHILQNIKKGKRKYPRFSSRHVVLLEARTDADYIRQLSRIIEKVKLAFTEDIASLRTGETQGLSDSDTADVIINLLLSMFLREIGEEVILSIIRRIL